MVNYTRALDTQRRVLRRSSLEYCQRLNTRVWQWEDWAARWFAERAKLQDTLRSMEQALRVRLKSGAASHQPCMQ